MQQFVSPHPKLTLPLNEQDTAPTIRAFPAEKFEQLIYQLRQQKKSANFSFLEWIAVFFISTGLLFLISTMAVLFWKLFIVVLHT